MVPPKWATALAIIRQSICLVLGAWLIVYAAVTQGHDIPFLIVGLILIGLMPVDVLLDKLHRRRDPTLGPTTTAPDDKT